MTLADELRSWRLSRGWTQEQAALYLEVPLSTYANWEQGHRRPNSLGAIRKLMEMAPAPE